MASDPCFPHVRLPSKPELLSSVSCCALCWVPVCEPSSLPLPDVWDYQCEGLSEQPHSPQCLLSSLEPSPGALPAPGLSPRGSYPSPEQLPWGLWGSLGGHEGRRDQSMHPGSGPSCRWHMGGSCPSGGMCMGCTCGCTHTCNWVLPWGPLTPLPLGAEQGPLFCSVSHGCAGT